MIIRRFVDIGAMVALCLVALVPFSSAYDGLDYWIAAGGGALLGAVIAAAGARWRLNALVLAALTVMAYFVFGTALAARSLGIAGVVPSLDSLMALATGVIQVWKRALTLAVPLDVFPGLTIAPFILALVTTVTAASLAARARRWAPTALVVIGALLAFSIALGTFDASFPVAVGVVIAAIAFGWLTWRRALARASRESLPNEADIDGAPRRRSPAAIAAAAGIILVACAVGGGAAAAMPMSSRDVLRDQVVPPLDLHDYASPLTQFRKLTTDGTKTTLFTVTGLPEGGSIRLATLDFYDGTVYAVSGGGGAGAGSFGRVGRSIQTDAPGETASVTVTVDALSGVWMPTVGYLTTLGFTGDDANTQNANLHYNGATGTAIDIAGVHPGDTYAFTAKVAAPPSEQQLAEATVANVTTPRPDRVPDALGTVLASAVGDAKTPVEQIRAVETYFSKNGFFSNGLAGQAVSRAGHSLSRENDLLSAKQMIGDDEQYAVVMALALSQLGIPSRVVMGFVPSASTAASGPVSITGADVHAWVEVPFNDLGWVSFSPTPPKDRVPEEITEQQKQKPQGQVVQPPDTPQEPAELPPAPPTQDAQNEKGPASLAWLWAIVRIAGLSLLALLIVSLPSIALAIVQRRKRKARFRAAEPSTRIGGGWAEVVDAAADVRLPVAQGATRRENAAALEGVLTDSGMTALAQRADAAVFGAGEPSEREIAEYWDDIATARRQVLAVAPWWRRLGARLWPASALRSVRDGAVRRIRRLGRRKDDGA